MIRLMLALSCACLATAALADTEIHLEQSAQKTIGRDRLRADLRVEAQGSDSRAVQDEVNRRMGAALAASRKVSGVTLESGGYAVYREQSGIWHASQSLALTSKDFDALLNLAGDLQGDGLVMSGLRFFLAPETLRAAQSELTAQALSALRERAGEVAADLGMTVARYKDLNIGNAMEAFNGPRPMMMARMASSAAKTEMTPPDAQAGDSTVSLQVTAEVTLTDKPR